MRETRAVGFAVGFARLPGLLPGLLMVVYDHSRHAPFGDPLDLGN
jgi:hypothetical protein